MLEEKNDETQTTETNNDEEIDLVAELQKQLAEEKAKSAKLTKEKNTLARDILNNNSFSESKPEEEQVVRTKTEIQKDFAEAKRNRDMLRTLELSLELDDAYLREDDRSSYLPNVTEFDADTGKATHGEPTADEELTAKKARMSIEAICKEIGTNLKTYKGGDPVKLQQLMKDYYNNTKL